MNYSNRHMISPIGGEIDSSILKNALVFSEKRLQFVVELVPGVIARPQVFHRKHNLI